MPGPGEYRPDPSPGHHPHRGLAQAQDPAARAEITARRPCPRCGQGASRDRRVRRTLHDLGNPLTGRPRELIVISSQHYCTRCRRSLNADMTDLAAPGSHSTKRVVDTAVRLVIEDSFHYRTASWSLWRDHRVFVPYATIQNWVEDGVKGTAVNSPTDYLDWALSDSRAISPLTSCMTARSVSCRSSITAPSNGCPTTSWTATRPKSTSRGSSRRFRQALEARGLTVQGITTDGSTLYPEPYRRSLRCGAASGLPIPHPARGEQGDPLGRGPGTQASGSRCPQIAAGPSQLKGGQACRWVQEADQAEGG